jgi:hypothetical protein
MRHVIVRYKTKPEAADENQALIEAVFEELAATKPEGLKYASFRGEDGTFVHVAGIEGDTNPLAETAAFKAFQKDLKERCAEPPAPLPVTKVGTYGF